VRASFLLRCVFFGIGFSRCAVFERFGLQPRCAWQVRRSVPDSCSSDARAFPPECQAAGQGRRGHRCGRRWRHGPELPRLVVFVYWGECWPAASVPAGCKCAGRLQALQSICQCGPTVLAYSVVVTRCWGPRASPPRSCWQSPCHPRQLRHGSGHGHCQS
jgi:hypothetical protein